MILVVPLAIHMEHLQSEQCIGNVGNLPLREAWALGKRNRTKFQKPRRPLNATFTKIWCRLHYLTGKAQIVRHGLFTNTHGIAYANHFHMPTKCEAFSPTSPSFIPNTKSSYKMGVKDSYCFFETHHSHMSRCFN